MPALPNWGSLQKDTDDPTTIEEAIANAIDAHQADSAAHLDSGGSLQSHKSEDVIDHPQGSVVADKAGQTEVTYSVDFSVLTPWNPVGDVDIDNWPSVQLYVEDGATTQSYIKTQPQIPTQWNTYASDSLVQVGARFDMDIGDFDAFIGVGNPPPTTTDGYGFKWTAGVLTAVAKGGGTTHTSGTISNDYSISHIYRAQVDAAAGKVYFYIDGTLVATLDVPTAGDVDDSGPAFYIKANTGEDGSLWLTAAYFSHAL